jgi:hypothetical protein
MHSSKSGRSAFAHIARLDVIELLSTDQLPEPDLRDALAAAEVEIVIAAGLSRLCVTGSVRGLPTAPARGGGTR